MAETRPQLEIQHSIRNPTNPTPPAQHTLAEQQRTPGMAVADAVGVRLDSVDVVTVADMVAVGGAVNLGLSVEVGVAVADKQSASGCGTKPF